MFPMLLRHAHKVVYLSTFSHLAPVHIVPCETRRACEPSIDHGLDSSTVIGQDVSVQVGSTACAGRLEGTGLLTSSLRRMLTSDRAYHHRRRRRFPLQLPASHPLPRRHQISRVSTPSPRQAQRTMTFSTTSLRWTTR